MRRRVASDRGPPQPGDQSARARAGTASVLAMRGSCAETEEQDASCALLTRLPAALIRRVVEVRDSLRRCELHCGRASPFRALTASRRGSDSAVTWRQLVPWRARASRCAPSPPTTGAGALAVTTRSLIMTPRPVSIPYLQLMGHDCDEKVWRRLLGRRGAAPGRQRAPPELPPAGAAAHAALGAPIQGAVRPGVGRAGLPRALALARRARGAAPPAPAHAPAGDTTDRLINMLQ